MLHLHLNYQKQREEELEEEEDLCILLLNLIIFNLILVPQSLLAIGKIINVASLKPLISSNLLLNSLFFKRMKVKNILENVLMIIFMM